MKFRFILLERRNSSSSFFFFWGGGEMTKVFLSSAKTNVLRLYSFTEPFIFHLFLPFNENLHNFALWLRQVSDGRVNGTSCYLLFKTYTDLYQSDQRLQNLGRRGTGTSYRRGQQETKSD